MLPLIKMMSAVSKDRSWQWRNNNTGVMSAWQDKAFSIMENSLFKWTGY
jgi:hypothetical protein